MIVTSLHIIGASTLFYGIYIIAMTTPKLVTHHPAQLMIFGSSGSLQMKLTPVVYIHECHARSHNKCRMCWEEESTLVEWWDLCTTATRLDSFDISLRDMNLPTEDYGMLYLQNGSIIDVPYKTFDYLRVSTSISLIDHPVKMNDIESEITAHLEKIGWDATHSPFYVREPTSLRGGKVIPSHYNVQLTNTRVVPHEETVYAVLDENDHFVGIDNHIPVTNSTLRYSRSIVTSIVAFSISLLCGLLSTAVEKFKLD
jgi:hypothetical protein